MRLPISACEQLRESSLDPRDAQHGFRIARRHPVPEAPEIFERGISVAVEESMLQAIDFVARESVGHIHHVPWLEPFRLVYHRHERIRRVFPCDPVIPAEVGPCERFVADIELRFERERMSRGFSCRTEMLPERFRACRN